MELDNKSIFDSIEQSKQRDFSGLTMYSFWYKFYFIVYPLSKWFVKHNISPNTITLLMLPSALLSAIFFISGNIYLVLCGSIIIHWFQIFDFCDGKVARATQSISLYGREFDYLMHVICHPIIFISFYRLLLMLNSINQDISLIVILIGSIVETTNRSLHNLNDAILEKKQKQRTINIGYTRRMSVFSLWDNINRGIVSFPYFMCWAPLLFFLDYFFCLSYSFFFIAILIQIMLNGLNVLKLIISLFRRCFLNI